MRQAVLGIDPGGLPGKAWSACAVLCLEPPGTIGLFRETRALPKSGLADFLRHEPLFTDERLRMAAVAAPLTPVLLERKPIMARRIELRFSRGAFSASRRGPQLPWISDPRSGWLRYKQGMAVLDLLRTKGFPLLEMPADGAAPDLAGRCSVEVFPRATLALLVPPEHLQERPVFHHFMGQLDDWLFPRIFLPAAGSDSTRVLMEEALQGLAPGLHLTPEVLAEARRIAGLRRPYSRRENLRAFVAALQGALALAGAACLVGATGPGEGSFLLPAAWYADWENEWHHPRRFDPQVRRVHV